MILFFTILKISESMNFSQFLATKIIVFISFFYFHISFMCHTLNVVSKNAFKIMEPPLVF